MVIIVLPDTFLFFSFCLKLLCEVVEGVLCPNLHVINEDIRQCQPKSQPLAYNTGALPPAERCATAARAVTATQPVCSPLHYTRI